MVVSDLESVKFWFPFLLDLKIARGVKLSIEAKLLNTQGAQRFDAEIADISASGCQVRIKDRSEDSFLVGNRLYVTFNILEKSVEADCVLRNIRESEDALLLGMEFANLTPANADLINAFIEMISKVSGAP